MTPQTKTYDVLIIGSGGAGLSLALKLAESARIAVLSKQALTEGSTYYAQGGFLLLLTHKIQLHRISLTL